MQSNSRTGVHVVFKFTSWFFIFSIIVSYSRPLFAAEPTAWGKYQYSVVKITDGDTFVATDGNISFRVRIAGMDAPEKAQAYGKIAKAALGNLLTAKSVTIKTVGNGLDQYGRVLGIVFVENKDVAADMIEQGLATYYRPRCNDYPADKSLYNYDPRAYIAVEDTAKAKKLNFWSGSDTILPCQYRREH